MFALENVKGYIYFILLEYVEEEEENNTIIKGYFLNG
jgi:hypothetical protein